MCHSVGTLLLTFVALCPLVITDDVHAEQGTSPPNVLFIAIDDLRPELNCYGRTHIQSPNIDALAASGTLFERAYCMVPTCGASRSSLMTGLRPSRNRFVSYFTRADEDAKGVTTLNTHFKNNGYYTVSNGKVFHHRDDSEIGWSEKAWRPNANSYQLKVNQRLHARPGRKKRGPAFESSATDDAEYSDGVTTDKTIADLRRLANHPMPFFLAVGFAKPHLPFVAPQKYWDLYDPEDIHLPANYKVPRKAPAEAIHNSGELRAYHGIPPKGPVSDETALSMIHGYYACVSFVDAQIGQLLSELDQLGLSKNTIVVLWGDHGWNLGDHTLWCKHSCFESSMHAPLIIRAPGKPAGTRTTALTEFIDIYPTLCELAGLKSPSHLQGRSVVPLLEDPDASWKDTAIGRFQSGDTVRTDRFRYSEYTTSKGLPTAEMLYDHDADPLENRNLSEQDAHAQQVQELRKQLHDGKGRDRDL